MNSIKAVMPVAPVIPVIVLEDVASAVSVAEALVAGGLPVIEVTLRTRAALDIIREMRSVPGAIVGAGTVLNPGQLDAAMEAGAKFIVSPGLTDTLARAAIGADVPFLPGTACPGDIMRALDFGFTHLKFFPAVASGGVPALSALASVFGDVRFCPTGGITEATAPTWLALDAVHCVGGSWVVPKGEPDKVMIEVAARRAASLRG